MLGGRGTLIAQELADGTGAAIAVRPVAAGLRQGVRLWFSDLGEKHGPVAEMRPMGLKSHAVRLFLGPFSNGVIARIRQADPEDAELARALFRSIPERVEVDFPGQDPRLWTVADGTFEVRARYRHEEHHPDDGEAIVATCREIMVPMMAAMAELIGYDVEEDPSATAAPAEEGAFSRAVVSRRERNPRSRLLCLRIHGSRCKACGVDPLARYGTAGGIIEVHHLEPLSLLAEPRPYDPETDLVPLCPCCHRAVHTRRPVPVHASDSFHQPGSAAASSMSPEIEVPCLAASLFPYQARGIRWMHGVAERNGGLILADEMGLGKTLQVIALLLMDPPPPESPALVVCPTSLIVNWVREIGRFAPSLSVMVHRGPQRTGVYRGLQQANVVVTTYDTMVNDIAIINAFEWSWVICDEAQAIKNPDSLRRREVATIPRRRTLPMTGTPVENSLVDLWSLMDFAVPGLLGTRREFERTYPDTLEAAQALNRVTDPVILRRRVSEVAGDLPERIDVDLPIELGEGLAGEYVRVREETIARYPVAGALVATLQLQLFCAHPWLRIADPDDLDGEDAEVSRQDALPLVTPKMERTVAILREVFANGRKVIVFALFNRLDGLIREACRPGEAVFWDAINGSTPQAGRQEIIDRFSAHDGPGCLVLNPKAAGAGLNITAATVVVHYTPVWNPALETQASARAYRRGQTMPVTIHRLFYEDTVERVMLDRSTWRQELGNGIAPLSSRDGEDLRRALEIQPVST